MPEALHIIHIAVHLAQKYGQPIYLVGGVVRDLLLNHQALDIDLVLEGNALDMARQLASTTGNTVTLHTEFHTAKLQLPSFTLDLASARSEYYQRPGDLPAVFPADISTDLRRRDFSINAMAISLNAENYGQLLDECGGLSDLQKHLIRVLHKQSFRDDATRMWRAIRYEQRLNFRIERTTEVLLKQNLSMLNSISRERLWYELECIFGETQPENVLLRATELGLLYYIHPQIACSILLDRWYEHARQMSLPQKPGIGLYLALFLYDLEAAACEEIIESLKLSKNLSHILRDSVQIKTSFAALENSILSPSFIYRSLCNYDTTAIKANLIASESDNARRHIQLYLKQLCDVKPILNGNDLLALGIKPGPSISTILNRLLNARLDGEISSHEDEILWIEQHRWLP